MDRIRQDIDARWKGAAQKYFWGDPLDVRYHLCAEVARIHGKRVLDGGCNVGIVSSFLDISNDVTGIDLDEHAISLARKIAPHAHFVVGDLFDASLRADPYDVAILSHVLPGHDFPSDRAPAELVSSVRELIKPGGMLIVTSPNNGNPYYRDKGKISIAELEKLLTMEGWDAQVYGWNPFPIQAGHLLRYMPRILTLLTWLMRRGIGRNRAVALYGVAVRR